MRQCLGIAQQSAWDMDGKHLISVNSTQQQQ